jgi:hypothetical protein
MDVACAAAAGGLLRIIQEIASGQKGINYIFWERRTKLRPREDERSGEGEKKPSALEHIVKL